MNQELTTIAVTPVGNGVYRVFSLFDKESVAFTAQGLVELSISIAEHSETLEAEANQEAVQQSAGASILLSQR